MDLSSSLVKPGRPAWNSVMTLFLTQSFCFFVETHKYYCTCPGSQAAGYGSDLEHGARPPHLHSYIIDMHSDKTKSPPNGQRVEKKCGLS